MAFIISTTLIRGGGEDELLFYVNNSYDLVKDTDYINYFIYLKIINFILKNIFITNFFQLNLEIYVKI